MSTLAPSDKASRRWGRVVAAAAGVALLVLILVRPAGRHWWTMREGWNSWCVVASAMWLQALPFVVLGTLISAAIAAWLKPSTVSRVLPRHAALAVPIAGISAMALPGCECASVPTARRLINAGVPTPAALAFMLAAPAVNPVVLVSTAVAYVGRPSMVLARFGASLGAALTIGWIWQLADRGRRQPRLRFGPTQTRTKARSFGQTLRAGWPTFCHSFVTDLVDALAYLVIGAALAATLKLIGPIGFLGGLATNPLSDAVVFGLIAVLVALCSEADAFMAASFTGFSPVAQLAFMVVGPMVDVKLIAMQQGSFGSRFVWRFAPLTFVVCLGFALAAGMLLPR